MFNELNAMPLNSNFKLFKIMQISAAWLAISALAHCKFKFNVRRRNKIENKWNRVQAPPTRTLGNNGHTPCQSIFIGSDIVFCVCVCVCAATFSSVSFYFASFVVHWGAEFMAVIVIKAIFPFLSISALDGTGCLLPRDRYLIVTLSGKQPLPKWQPIIATRLPHWHSFQLFQFTCKSDARVLNFHCKYTT